MGKSGSKRTASAIGALAGAAASMVGKRYKQTLLNGTAKSVLKNTIRPVSSATATLTKRKTQYVTIKPGGATTSIFSHKTPAPAYMKQIFKQNAPQTFVTNSSGRLTSTNGLQATSFAASVISTATAGDFSGGDTGSILTQYYGGSIIAEQKSTLIYFKSVLMNYCFTNNQTNNIFVDIYDVVSTRDGTYGANDASHQGLIDSGMPIGMASLNVVPTQSPLFNQYWKVLKKTSIELGPGISHRHIHNIKLNKRWCAETMQTKSTYMQGMTTGVYIVAWGAPCHDATTVGNVSSGSVLLDLVATKQITYAVAEKAVTKAKYINLLPVLTTEREVNPESGVPGTTAS